MVKTNICAKFIEVEEEISVLSIVYTDPFMELNMATCELTTLCRGFFIITNDPGWSGIIVIDVKFKEKLKLEEVRHCTRSGVGRLAFIRSELLFELCCRYTSFSDIRQFPTKFTLLVDTSVATIPALFVSFAAGGVPLFIALTEIISKIAAKNIKILINVFIILFFTVND